MISLGRAIKTERRNKLAQIDAADLDLFKVSIETSEVKEISASDASGPEDFGGVALDLWCGLKLSAIFSEPFMHNIVQLVVVCPTGACTTVPRLMILGSYHIRRAQLCTFFTPWPDPVSDI